MKIHTTNYRNTFIEVAEDCPVNLAETPPVKGDKKSVANLQFEVLFKAPYLHTSDDVLFQVFAERNELIDVEYKVARQTFFSKGQPCFRTSPLPKRYGFGIHYDDYGRIACME